MYVIIIIMNIIDSSYCCTNLEIQEESGGFSISANQIAFKVMVITLLCPF